MPATRTTSRQPWRGAIEERDTIMRMQNVSRETLDAAVARANETYGGNVKVHGDTHTHNGPRSTTTVGRLSVSDSRGPGARRTWSGRRGPYVCWHAYRDVLRAIFALEPSAVIVTTMARYEGSEGFERTYPATADKNIGSMVRPAYMVEMCECSDEIRGDDA